MKIKSILSALLFLPLITANAQETPIKKSDLPKPANEFLFKYFKNSTLHHAIKDRDDRKISYEIMLADGSEIEFTEAGNWKEVDGKNKAIPTGFINQAILDYVKTNYAKEKIVKIDKDPNNIDVDLSNGIDLEFDLNGKFIRVDK